MKIYLLPSILLLGLVTAKQPDIFARSMRKRSSPLKKIRSAAKAAKHVASTTKTSNSPDVSSVSSISKDSRSSTKAQKAKAYKTFKRSFREAKASKSPSPPELSIQSNVSKSKSSKGKSSKGFRFPILDVSASEGSMSYDIVDSVSGKAAKASFIASFLDGGSLSFSYDYSYDYNPSATTTDPTIPAPLDDESPSDNNFGRVIFEYLSTCARVELDTDSCLVSETIDAFMNMDVEEVVDVRRFLQVSNGRYLQELPEEECGAFQEDEQEEFFALLRINKDLCDDVSDEEFNTANDAFMSIISNDGCWESLCAEDFSKLFLTILFDDATSCAGVDLDVPQCVKDHIIDLVLMVEDPTADMLVRRSLQQDEDPDPCDTPTEGDLGFFVQYMLIDADAACESVVDFEREPVDWDKARDDLVAIFSSSQCWGLGDCTEVDSSFDSVYSFPTESPVFDDEKDGRPVVTDDGTQCIFELDIDPEVERDLEITYYYQIETATSEEPDLGFILSGIEEQLIGLVCTDGRRKARRLEELPQDTVVVAVDSAPADTVATNYTCFAQNSAANGCYIVQGRTTVIVESESTEYDNEIIMGAYTKLEQLFALLPNVLQDDSIVDVQYLGKNFPSTTDETIIGKITKDIQDDSGINPSVWIASAGGLVAMAMLITGLKLMNNDKDEVHRHDELDTKSNGSNDGYSMGHKTADLTFTSSCDHSDISFINSPTRSVNSTSPTSNRGDSPEVAKFFILAEEEEENWRELSILPALAQDDGTLENVSEEGSFIGSVSTSSSQANDVGEI